MNDPNGDKLFSSLLGKTLAVVEARLYSSKAKFLTDKGERFDMFHIEDCCECVMLEEVVGDLKDITGLPLTQAEVVTNEMGDFPRKGIDESWTWTFYKLATIKGSVTLRWLGESNGYYSEAVTFARVEA